MPRTGRKTEMCVFFTFKTGTMTRGNKYANEFGRIICNDSDPVVASLSSMDKASEKLIIYCNFQLNRCNRKILQKFYCITSTVYLMQD